ncbi:hypothetical protein EMMF5_001024 [Cystobasidiomycetes sp. EMM_F5]
MDVSGQLHQRRCTLTIQQVGGQRSERRKWVSCFEGVNVLLFLIAVSELDQRLYEDSQVKRFEEAQSLFGQIANSAWFKNSQIILFLNKIDILAQKLPTIDLREHLPDYRGPRSLQHVLAYLGQSMLEQNHSQTSAKFLMTENMLRHKRDDGAGNGVHSLTVTTGAAERAEDALAVIVSAFGDDPAVRYITRRFQEPQRLEYLPHYMRALVKAGGLNGGIFDEIGNWGATAIWMPPGKRVDNPLTLLPAGMLGVLYNIGLKACYRMLYEYGPQADKFKSEALGKRKDYYYLWFIATRPEKQGQHMCAQLIRKQQTLATQQGLPIWLESTTHHSRDIYAHLGFRVVGSFRLGIGHTASNGREQTGGHGVDIYCMLWEPPKQP